MAIVIQRWRSKPTFVEQVQVTEDNYREVAEWLGAESVMIRHDGPNTTVCFEKIPERPGFGPTSLWVSIGDSVFKDEKGSPSSNDITDFKKKFKKV